MTKTNPIVRFGRSMFFSGVPSTNAGALCVFFAALLLLPFTWFMYLPLFRDNASNPADHILGGITLTGISAMFAGLGFCMGPDTEWVFLVTTGYGCTAMLLLSIAALVSFIDWLSDSLKGPE